jgi:hypothetical protein
MTTPFWFIRDGNKLIQCTKDAFDQAIREGKSVKYRTYQNKRAERTAEELEQSRMEMLSNLDLSSKLRAVLTNPANEVQVQIIDANDPLFWVKESKKPKYQI